MRWANVNGAKRLAEKSLQGFCPLCDAELIPKCGQIVNPYWSHQTGDCDTWSEPETQWHINWKKLFHPREQEVVMGSHRADVKTKHAVVELQHSSISVDEIREREGFYRNMLWIFDCRKQYENNQIFHGLQKEYKEQGIFIQEVWWRWSKQSILACTQPVLLHLKRGVLMNIYGFGTSTRLGFGHLINKTAFLKEVHAELGTENSIIRYPNHWPSIRPKEPADYPPSEYDHYEPTDEEIAQMEEWPDDEL